MSEPEHPCVRGCTKPGPLMDDGQRGEDVPRMATDGLLCSKDARNLKTWLEEIPDLYAQLDTRMEGGYSTRYDGKTGKTGKASHSPALVRLDVVALQDPRTLRDEDLPGEPLYIPRVVGSWAYLLAEEHDLASPTDTLVEAVNLLLTWWSTLVAKAWVDEFFTDVHDCSKLLNRANNVERPRSVGTCISIVGDAGNLRECGRQLYALEGAAVRCASCHRRYDGMDLVRVATTREQAERSVAG
jgi:hypothetical protein